VAQFIFGAVETDQDPAFVKIGGLGCNACVNQHCCCLDTVGLEANAINPVSETGKHLATHFPTVQLGRGIGGGRTGQSGAYPVDKGA